MRTLFAAALLLGISGSAFAQVGTPPIAVYGSGNTPQCTGGQFVNGPGSCSTPAGGGNMSGTGSSISGNVLQSNTTGTPLAATTDSGIAISNLGLLSGTQTFSGSKTFSATLNATGTFELGGNAFVTSSALTLPAPTSNGLLVGTSGTAVGNVTPADSSVLTTNGGGTPSWSSTLPVGNCPIGTTSAIGCLSVVSNGGLSATGGGAASLAPLTVTTESGGFSPNNITLLYAPNGSTSITGTLANPGSSAGSVFQFADLAGHGFSVTTSGGSASLEGNFASATTLAVPPTDSLLCDDGTSIYACAIIPAPEMAVRYTSNTATLTLPRVNNLLEVIAQSVPAAITINLVATPGTNMKQCVKDGGNGFATNPASIETTDGSKIDGVASGNPYYMTINYQNTCFLYDGTQWNAE